jgi:hypothetical protein
MTSFSQINLSRDKTNIFSYSELRMYSVQTIGGQCGYVFVDIISYIYYSQIIITEYSFTLSEYCLLRIISQTDIIFDSYRTYLLNKLRRTQRYGLKLALYLEKCTADDLGCPLRTLAVLVTHLCKLKFYLSIK